MALAARAHGIPFYVCAPTATIDMACPTGADIPIEMRDASEVTELHYAHRMAPAGVKVYNPAFDVTPAEHVSALVTERGIVRAPYAEGLARIMR